MNIRLDTYLWAIRIYKSRSLAADAIKNNKVKLNNEIVKPAHLIKLTENYTISLPLGVKKIIEVSGFIDKRQSFDVAKKHYVDHTPNLDKIETAEFVLYTVNLKRDRGTGRPTKKDKRDLTNFGWE